MKKEEIRVFHYLRGLSANNKGITIAETLIVAFISIVILGALLLALTTGQFSSSLNSEKLELQAEVRSVLDWITKDMRESVITDLANTVAYTPSNSYLRFHLWDWNTGSGQIVLRSEFIEYIYDDSLDRLTRNFVDGLGNVITSHTFSDIIEPPFYTEYLGTGNPGNQFVAGTLLTSRQLTIVVTGQKHIRGSAFITDSLQSQIRIRNG